MQRFAIVSFLSHGLFVVRDRLLCFWIFWITVSYYCNTLLLVASYSSYLLRT